MGTWQMAFILRIGPPLLLMAPVPLTSAKNRADISESLTDRVLPAILRGVAILNTRKQFGEVE